MESENINKRTEVINEIKSIIMNINKSIDKTSDYISIK